MGEEKDIWSMIYAVSGHHVNHMNHSPGGGDMPLVDSDTF